MLYNVCYVCYMMCAVKRGLPRTKVGLLEAGAVDERVSQHSSESDCADLDCPELSL